MALSHYMSTKFSGDAVALTVWRQPAAVAAAERAPAGVGGPREAAVSFPLSVQRRLVPYHWENKPPPYLVMAGMVFTALSVPYLEVEGAYKNFESEELSGLLTLARAPLGAPGDEVVILSSVLAHRANLGYEHLENLRLKALNGDPVRSLAHLAALVQGGGGGDPFLRFTFDGGGGGAKVVVLDAALVAEATEEVCEENAIPHPCRLVAEEATPER